MCSLHLLLPPVCVTIREPPGEVHGDGTAKAAGFRTALPAENTLSSSSSSFHPPTFIFVFFKDLLSLFGGVLSPSLHCHPV